jgi:hypothetical protein
LKSIAPVRRLHREKQMQNAADDKDNAAVDAVKQSNDIVPKDDRMEDEEKILAGRHDANFPALLTKDVPGG